MEGLARSRTNSPTVCVRNVKRISVSLDLLCVRTSYTCTPYDLIASFQRGQNASKTFKYEIFHLEPSDCWRNTIAPSQNSFQLQYIFYSSMVNAEIQLPGNSLCERMITLPFPNLTRPGWTRSGQCWGSYEFFKKLKRFSFWCTLWRSSDGGKAGRPACLAYRGRSIVLFFIGPFQVIRWHKINMCDFYIALSA